MEIEGEEIKLSVESELGLKGWQINVITFQMNVSYRLQCLSILWLAVVLKEWPQSSSVAAFFLLKVLILSSNVHLFSTILFLFLHPSLQLLLLTGTEQLKTRRKVVFYMDLSKQLYFFT